MENPKIPKDRAGKEKLQNKAGNVLKAKPTGIHHQAKPKTPVQAKPRTPVQARPIQPNQAKPQEPKELSEYLKKRKEDVERAMGHRKHDTKNKPKTPELKKPVTPNKR